MITLHHLNNSRSQRILWLLEELEVPYELKTYRRNLQTLLAPPELKRVHPLGKSPIITDGTLVVAESGAIIEYLLDVYGHGRLRPSAGTPEFLLYRFYLHLAEGSLMPPMLLSLILWKTTQAPTPFFIRPFAKAIAEGVRAKFLGPQIKTYLDFLESELSLRPWFAGQEMTGADIQMSFPLEAAEVRFGLQDRPRLSDFLKRVRARPAYQRALRAGGEYNLS